MTRNVEMTHPLGGDKLVFYRITTTERLGGPFEYELEVMSPDRDVAIADVLGKAFCVKFETREGNERYFHGLASEFRFVGSRGDYAHYLATLRPWLSVLELTANCRIFQNKKVPDIIKEVFRDLGFTDFEDKLQGDYPELEYCVQYRESDFDFVSRLMERFGIYYYFTHSKSKHSLVLANKLGSHSTASGYSKVVYYPPDADAGRRDKEHLSEISVGGCLQTGKYKVNSFDFTKPKADLLGSKVESRSNDHADHEVYDYIADYGEQKLGDGAAEVRLLARQSAWETVSASGDCCGLGCGDLFTVSESPRSSLDKEHLIVSASHDIRSDDRESTGGGGGGRTTETIAIEAMASSETYRSPEVTPAPVIYGPQTAMVVGKKGEEIWTDEHGRIKVQFHWDRDGKSDENSSCWVRVAQAWAGKGWGSWHLPRIGQEVVVQFMNGDPDQPLVTGSVYNGDNKIPYTMPDDQTQSGIKSRSTKKGAAETFNELRFEDKKDKEQIYFHAQKDFERYVEDEDKLTVEKGDQLITLDKGTRNVTIKKGDQIVKLDMGKSTQEAMKSIELKVGGNSIKIDQKGITIKGMMVKVEGSGTAEMKSPMTTVKGDGMLTLQGALTKIN
jgi:type VI secretion system secreted protein VgrG